MSTLRLPDGRVVQDGRVIHQPLYPIVRELRQFNAGLNPLALAIAKALGRG